MSLKTHLRAHKDDSAAEKLDNDLDSLMDKYDEAEKKPKEDVKLEKKTNSKGEKISAS